MGLQPTIEKVWFQLKFRNHGWSWAHNDKVDRPFLLGQWLNLKNFWGWRIFSRENKPFKLFFSGSRTAEWALIFTTKQRRIFPWPIQKLRIFLSERKNDVTWPRHVVHTPESCSVWKISLVSGFHLGWWNTLPETNIAPENGWLEYVGMPVSFWDGLFSSIFRGYVSFRECDYCSIWPESWHQSYILVPPTSKNYYQSPGIPSPPFATISYSLLLGAKHHFLLRVYRIIQFFRTRNGGLSLATFPGESKQPFKEVFQPLGGLQILRVPTVTTATTFNQKISPERSNVQAKVFFGHYYYIDRLFEGDYQ